MSKDVDLTSKEWCDLIFEGKNKEFGAYVLRRTSENRHTKAVIYSVIGAIVVFGIVWGYATVKQMIEEQELKDQAEQELAALTETTEEKSEEVQQQKIEEKKPEPEMPKEAQVAVTQLEIKPDAQVTKPPISQDELKTDTKEVGQINQEGEKANKLELKKEDFQETAPKIEVKEPEKPKEEKPKEEENKVFTSVEQMPKFPGGDGALLKYISSHIQYPAMDAENGTEGRVVLQFVVTKSGSVGEVKVVRSLSPGCDSEAKRVVKSLPSFTPGRQNGQPVNVWYTLPVTFKLQH